MSFGSSPFGGFGQPNPNQGSGFGGFGSNNNNPTGSAFGPSNNNVFGSNNNTNTSGGLFGNPSGGGFGGTGGAFGPTSNTGGFGAKPPFGSTTTTAGGGLFGSTPTATSGNTGFGGGGFGNNTTSTSSPFGGGGTSLFGGGNKNGFGSTAPTNTSSSLFGGSTVFGGNTGSTFGATSNPGIGTNIGDPPGTAQVAFAPFIEKESTGSQSNSFQNILFQDAYKKWSADELRMADYTQGRRYGNAGGGAGAFGVGSGFGAGFGSSNTQTSAFGNNTAGSGLFGNNNNNQTPSAFGQNNSTGSAFGSGGLFGQNKPGGTGTGLFGSATPSQPAQTGGGLFGGSSTTGGFGSTNTTTNAFGSTNTGGGLFGNNNNQNKTTAGFGGFGSTGNTTSNAFGNTGTTNAFGTNNNTNTGGGLFGNTAQNTNTSGGLFGNNNNQQQTQPSGFGSAFGAQNNNTGGGLFGNQQQKPATSLFGNTATQNTGGGLFGNTNTASNAFGQTNNQQQSGGLFGAAKPATTGGGLFGSLNTQQNNQTSSGLFGNLGQNNQTQQQPAQGSSLFGNLNNNNQQKPSIFGNANQATGSSVFGQAQPAVQQQGSIFGTSTVQQPQQNSIFGNSLFNNSQNNQSAPQSLTASLNDVSAFGTPSLFAGLGNGEVKDPGPLATPLSGKNKTHKPSILPLWKFNPASATKFVTPPKRGYGFSYSTYGSPATPPSTSSTPGAFGQSLAGGSLSRALSKSISSSSLRKSFNAEDSILAPGSFSASTGPRSYSSAGIKRLNIDRSMRYDLFSSPSKDKQIQDSSNGSGRKLPKRVSFDTSTVEPVENGAPQTEKSTPQTPSSSTASPSINGSKSAPNSSPEMEQVKGNELAVVQEEEPPAPAAKRPKPSGDMSAGEYFMSPTKEEIEAMNRVQRSQVADFAVGRKNVGQVRFKVPVDLTKFDLKDIPGGIVVLEMRSATVYPVSAKKPPVGKGLNVPAIISLENSWPRGRGKLLADKSGHQYTKHVERLKRIEETSFIDYNAETGVWTFSVEHFTTYGLDYDEDTDGEAVGTSEAANKEPTSVRTRPSADGAETSPEEHPEDTFEFRRKRRALPGAFDYTGGVSDDEQEMSVDNGESFLSDRSAGSASNALVQVESDNMDEEHAVPEGQDASADLGYHQAAEQEADSLYPVPEPEYQETPGGIMRARMRAIKNSNKPLDLQVADGDEWMDMLQKTISPQKRDRSALKSLGEAGAYEATKETTQQAVSPVKSRVASDGRGFATSIDLMNSLFEKAKSPVKPAAPPAVIPTKGFKWPYNRQEKSIDHDEANMDPIETTYHDTLRPSWGPDGTLVMATAAKVLTRSSQKSLEREGLMAMTKVSIVSESRDVRFAKFSNESSAKALGKHMAMTTFNLDKGIPTASLSQVNKLVSFFHEQDLHNPANSHEKMVWELASILFDDVSTSAGVKATAPESRRIRKKNLSEFWENLVDDASTRAVGLARSPEDKAIASLSGHHVANACKHLLDGKNFRLATLVSLIGTSDQSKKDMRDQVKEWHERNLLSEFSEPIRAIYELLGGNVCTCEGMKGAMENRMDSFVISRRFGMDWKQAFGLRLWYATSSSEDGGAAVRSFEDDIEQDREPRPQPWFAEQGIAPLWQDADKDIREDLLWGLLRLFAEKGTDLEEVLRPENSQLSPLDFRLCWQLGRALANTGKVSFGEDADEKADAATLSFASQLVNEGDWLEATFVLLHLSSSAARAKAVQEHLARHAGLIGGDQSEDFLTLTQTFRVPPAWIWQAKALYMRSIKKDAKAEVIYLLRARSFTEAHKTCTRQVAPVAVIEREYDGLWDILEQFQGAEKSIADWNLGGGLYRNFLELHDLVGRGQEVPPELPESLMDALAAVHASASEEDVMELAALADMASDVAKVVADLTDKRVLPSSTVLGLPLTEDGYLKYSNKLAFDYYRQVMVGP